ncbi:MAG: glycosyl hydrolase [Bacteroidota bacterium]
MKRRDFIKTSGALGAAAVITPWGVLQHKAITHTVNTLESDFATPPQSAKPHTWWHWMNGNVTKEGITLDLEAMARVGIGGFQNFDAGTGIPKGPVVYLSPEWLELKKHAIAEAQRLGLEFTMHNCPGWSSSGGPWITPELAMQQVVWTEINIDGQTKEKIVLKQPEAKLNFYKDICVVAFERLDDRQMNWDKRANFAFNRYGVDEIPEGAPALLRKDVTALEMKPDGEVKWTPRKGQWTLIRFGYTPIGTQNRSAPDTGVGLECDKYSASAFEFHFNKMMENLLPFLEPLGRNGKVGLLIDSYEVGMQNWTPGFEKIFENANNYPILQYMPALTGRVVESADVTNRFLWDLRRTQGDLMANNYYGKFTELCHKHNILSYIQPYDRGPMEEMQIGSRIDINVGEFWNNLSSIFQNNWTMRRTVKLSAAIAHTNGQKIVAAESYTGEPESSKWQEYPFGLKLLGDRMFAQGLNRMIFHRFAHQPHPTARPGMTMGPWGSHFDRTNTWWDHGAKEWMTYLSRCQYLLQQGTFVADLVYFTGEDAGVYTRVERDELKPSPPEGYDYDLINSEVLLNKAKVIDKGLVLPDGTSYRLLILQDFKTMSLKVLKKVKEFADSGLVVMGEKPARTPGLTNDQAEFTKLADELWTSEKIIAGRTVEHVLEHLALDKDFEFTSSSGDAPLVYLHRKTSEGDIYFIANQRRTFEEVICNFRISNKQPEIWDPVTGKLSRSKSYSVKKDVVTVKTTLHESQSLFIVFRNNVGAGETTQVIPGGAATTTIVRQLSNEQNTFKVPVIKVKPENSIMLSINGFMDGQLPWTDFYCIFPAPGEKLYGKGHSTLGLTVGRNGIAVWENANGKPEFNFSVERPISGWVIIQLTCDDGVPSVYVDGELAKSGVKSKYTVHPAPTFVYLNEGASFYNGDVRPAFEKEIIDGAISLQEAWEVSFPANSGAPASIQLPELISLHKHADKGVKYFSGTCTYKKTFKGFKKGYRYTLHLGAVEVIAEIIVNGKSFGVMWTRPFLADITDAMTKGDNHIEIRVTNLWVNRLIGDEQEPEVYKYAPGGGGSGFKSLSGGAIMELPDWYKKGEPKPDDGRVAFATWKHYTKDSPLLQSGLIGPVRLFEIKI